MGHKLKFCAGNSKSVKERSSWNKIFFRDEAGGFSAFSSGNLFLGKLLSIILKWSSCDRTQNLITGFIKNEQHSGLKIYFMKNIQIKSLFLLALLAPLLGSTLYAKPVTIRILWTNDTHAYLKPSYHREENQANYEKIAAKEGKLGGFAYLSSEINRLRSEMPKNTLLLDGGDTFHGTAVPLFGQGKPVLKVMNAMGYTAMVPGNVDLLYPKEVLLARREEANFPIIAANISDMEWGDPVLDQYIMKTVAGVKVAIVGMAYQWTAKTGDRKLTQGWRFGLREREISKLITNLRKKKGAQVVILLSHMGFQVDQKYASRVKGIDAIVGAHTHDITKVAPRIGKTIVVQAGSNGTYLGLLDIKVNKGKVKGFDHKIIRIVSKNIKPDKKIEALIEKAYAPYRKKLEKVVGVTKTMLYRRARWQSTMDNFITDAYRKMTGADVAFAPAWRFGATIIPGNITVEDVYNMVPTKGNMVTYRMSGQIIMNVLEGAIDNVLNEDPYLQLGGDMTRFAGMEVRYNVKNKMGKRIVSVRIGGKPLNPKKKYLIASANTSFHTAPGVTALKDTGKMAVEELIGFIRKKSPIAPKIDKRIGAGR